MVVQMLDDREKVGEQVIPLRVDLRRALPDQKPASTSNEELIQWKVGIADQSIARQYQIE